MKTTRRTFFRSLLSFLTLFLSGCRAGGPTRGPKRMAEVVVPEPLRNSRGETVYEEICREYDETVRTKCLN